MGYGADQMIEISEKNEIQNKYLDFVNSFLGIQTDFEKQHEIYTDVEIEQLLGYQTTLDIPAMGYEELKNSLHKHNENVETYEREAQDEAAQYFYLQEKYAQEND